MPKRWYEANMSGGQGLVIDEATGGSIAVVYDKANAKLIAAAPRLLAALEKVIAISDRKHDAWDEAKAAITAARGEDHD